MECHIKPNDIEIQYLHKLNRSETKLLLHTDGEVCVGVHVVRWVTYTTTLSQV